MPYYQNTIRVASVWCPMSLMEFDGCWMLKTSVTKTAPHQSQQSQFPSQRILDAEVVPLEDCLTVSTVLSLPITGQQSRRAGGRGERERHCEYHFYEPVRLSEWWKSTSSVEHWAPSTRSPVNTSLFIIYEGNAPLRLSLDWTAASMIKRDLTQEAHLDREKPGHVTAVTNQKEMAKMRECKRCKVQSHLTQRSAQIEFRRQREDHQLNQLPLATSESEVITRARWTHKATSRGVASGFPDATKRRHQAEHNLRQASNSFHSSPISSHTKKSTQEPQ